MHERFDTLAMSFSYTHKNIQIYTRYHKHLNARMRAYVNTDLLIQSPRTTSNDGSQIYTNDLILLIFSMRFIGENVRE